MAKRLHPALDEAMPVVVQVVNHIKGKLKCNRIFQHLCADERENFANLLHFTQIRWLSRGKCLTMFANQFDSVCEYTKEYPQFACLQNVDSWNFPWKPHSSIQPAKGYAPTHSSSTNSDAVRAVANSPSPFGQSHFGTNCRMR